MLTSLYNIILLFYDNIIILKNLGELMHSFKFIYFSPMHLLWVIVRPSSLRWFKQIPKSMFHQREEKNANLCKPVFSIFRNRFVWLPQDKAK